MIKKKVITNDPGRVIGSEESEGSPGSHQYMSTSMQSLGERERDSEKESATMCVCARAYSCWCHSFERVVFQEGRAR